jgi:hypothetical protein
MATIYSMPARGVEAEWHVPRFGPRRFRLLIGVLSLPHTAMALSFTLLGAMTAAAVDWRVVVMTGMMVLLGLGLSAHLFEAVSGRYEQMIGGAIRPLWLKLGAIVSGAAAIALSLHIWPGGSPWFGMLVLSEMVLVAAVVRNRLAAGARGDTGRAVAWGFIPVALGYVAQTGTLSLNVCILGLAMSLLSRVVVQAGRSYAAIQQSRPTVYKDGHGLLIPLRQVLTGVSLGVILLGVAIAAGRWLGA